MTAAKSADKGPAAADAGSAVSNDDLGVFLAAIATLLRETVGRFEETVGRVSGMVVTRTSRPDRELVVALQDFDRLQQEFVALGDVVAHFADAMQGGWPGEVWTDHHGHKAIAAISVSDLKERFLRHLKAVPRELASPQFDDVEF
jgi:hypothetical protein